MKKPTWSIQLRPNTTGLCWGQMKKSVKGVWGWVPPAGWDVGVGGSAFPGWAEIPWVGCPPELGPMLPSLSNRLSRRVQKYASRLDK